MDIFVPALEFTLSLVLRMGTVMFVSLFGIELFMQMGLMRYLRPVGRPLARMAGLPSEAAVSFLAAVGSMIAAHAAAARFHADGRLTDRELRITAVLNTVPFHVKETLTFQLPVVLPLLGFRLAMIYVAAFWLSGLLKLIFVLIWGQIFPRSLEGETDAFQDPAGEGEEGQSGLVALAVRAWHTRKKMYFKMMGLLAAVTLVVQLLTLSGMLSWLEKGVSPLTAALGLPGAVVGPVTTYIFNPTVGITYMSNLMAQGAVSGYEAITALMAGGLLMIPVTRLRRTLPRYISIFGPGNGSLICAMTMGFAMLARILVLAWILLFYH